jgi:hypothetical protein
MFDKVTQTELREKLHAFAGALGLTWYHHTEAMSGRINPDLLYDCVCEPCTNRKEVDGLREDFNLLLDYLGVEVRDGKRIAKKRKAKK